MTFANYFSLLAEKILCLWRKSELIGQSFFNLFFYVYCWYLCVGVWSCIVFVCQTLGCHYLSLYLFLFMQIVSAYPSWYFLVCVIVGFGFAFAFYYRLQASFFSAVIRRVLFALRALSVALLVFLLFNPFVQTTKKTLQNPIVIIALDNSESIILNKDSTFYRTAYQKNIQKLIQKLKSKVEVKTYSFGEKTKDTVDFSFKEKNTNIDQLLQNIDQRHTNQNIAALVLASDGLYNAGSNPIYKANNLKIPIYTLALGDTNTQKDLIIKNINTNSIAYLNNDFAIETSLEANGFQNQNTTLQLFQVNGKQELLLASKPITITSQRFFSTQNFIAQAKQSGLQHYRIRLKPLPNEITLTNNAKDVFIEILDNKSKILMLANAPHPDISALKQSLEQTQNTELKIELINTFSNDLQNTDLLILHQLPNANTATLMSKLKQSKLPILFVVGKQTSLPALNTFQNELSIQITSTNTNQVQAITQTTFGLFELSPTASQRLADFPPLEAPFANYKTLSPALTLLNQKIGSLKTNYPLLHFSQNQDQKMAFLCGEGIWKWYLNEFEQHNNHETFDELIAKTTQYLKAKQDNRPFKIKLPANTFKENEDITLFGTLLDPSLQPTNTPEVTLKINNTEGKIFDFVLNKTDQKYVLNIGTLPPNTYNYTAQTSLNGKQYTAKGMFSVKKIDIEATNTAADHSLLSSIATQTGAKRYYPNQTEQLLQDLLGRDDLKPISYTQNTVEELINWRWILLLLGLLLGAEWFLRKYKGSY